jgi:hypothetical protein
MTYDDFRQQLTQLIADSKPIPLRDVIEALDDEMEALRGDLYRQEHYGKKNEK